MQADLSTLKNKLINCYGNDDALLECKLARIQELSKHPLISDKDFNLARAPGRISFSKHCDYVNNDLMYFADDRDTFVAVSTETGTGLITIDNLDDKYPKFEINAHDLNQQVDKNSWISYPLALLQILKADYGANFDNINLNILVSSEIPAAGGLSSSHALLLGMLISLAYRLKITQLQDLLAQKNLAALRILQKVENARGFNSGLGDPAAQLLSRRGEFVCVKLEPELKYSYLPQPSEMAVITAPSFIHADKSLPEFAEANANIAAYKTLNQLAKEIFKNDALNFIGDVLDYQDEKQILSAIAQIKDERLRGLALYALSEGARVRNIPHATNLLQALGEHLNLSHYAESCAQDKSSRCAVNPTLGLKEHSGFYGASTKANDELQSLALSLEGVYGSSISGAGLGGNNIILCDKDKAGHIVNELIAKYYLPRGLEEKAKSEVHISRSSASASLII